MKLSNSMKLWAMLCRATQDRWVIVESSDKTWSTKAFDCVDHNKLWKKALKRWEYQTILRVPWETCMWVKKQQLEPCMEQLIGLRLKKECDRAVCCHPVCLTYMLSTSSEMLGWMLQVGIKIGGRNINNLRYADDTTLMAESEEELKSLLIRVKEESERASLRFNIITRD